MDAGVQQVPSCTPVRATCTVMPQCFCRLAPPSSSDYSALFNQLGEMAPPPPSAAGGYTYTFMPNNPHLLQAAPEGASHMAAGERDFFAMGQQALRSGRCDV